MEIYIYKIVIFAVLAFGSVVLLKWQLQRMHAEEKEWSKSPFTRKMLRPAGESLRLKIDRIRDEIAEVGVMLLLPFLFLPVMVVLLDFKMSNIFLLIILGGLSVFQTYSNWKKLRKLRKELRNNMLGYDGERYVAAELNGLMQVGWKVFHDIIVDDKPGGGESDFNIDHIAVCERGVFVFETKAMRKPLQGLGKGEKNHLLKVEDGKLHLPKGVVTSKPIRQVATNAEWISTWLTGSGAKKIPVIPVVVIPGWFIEGDRKGVRVLNEKALLSVVPTLGMAEALSVIEVTSISDRIEYKCRNVEGAA